MVRECPLRGGSAVQATIDRAAFLRALREANAYPHPVRRIEHLETHISDVFLTGEYAYKLKKPLEHPALVELAHLDRVVEDRSIAVCRCLNRLRQRVTLLSARWRWLRLVHLDRPHISAPRDGLDAPPRGGMRRE
jgi:hypothetical protein